ncbi:MAG: response regulator [Phycisphaeraceae bacterium]|nr:response regulator [Phycisphaeraceae bacterium]
MDYSKPDKPLPLSAPKSEREELLATLRAENERGQKATKDRNSHRFYMDECIVTCRIEHPGGGVANSEMLVSDISEHGIGVISRVYLHKGTFCSFTMKSNTGETIKANGRVIWCKLVARRFHAAGVKFEDPIDPKTVVSPKAWMERMAVSGANKQESLSGSVLVLVDDQVIFNLTKMMLSDTQLKLTQAADTGAAIDQIKSSSFDVLIMGLDLPLAEVDRAVSTIRREGYSGPIVFLTGESSNALLEHLMKNGHKYFLSKPIKTENLHGVLHNSMEERNDPSLGSAPLHSELLGAGVDEHWINGYIEDVRKMAGLLGSALKADDLKQAMSVCNTYQATGAGYGFPLLSEAAAGAIKALNASFSAKESATDLRKVLRIVDRIVASVQSADRSAA